jgi:hypothetical protein
MPRSPDLVTASSGWRDRIKIGLDDLVRRFLKKTNDPREVVNDPKAHYLGLEISDRSLTSGEGTRIAATRFDDSLNTSAQK